MNKYIVIVSLLISLNSGSRLLIRNDDFQEFENEEMLKSNNLQIEDKTGIDFINENENVQLNQKQKIQPLIVPNIYSQIQNQQQMIPLQNYEIQNNAGRLYPMISGYQYQQIPYPLVQQQIAPIPQFLIQNPNYFDVSQNTQQLQQMMLQKQLNSLQLTNQIRQVNQKNSTKNQQIISKQEIIKAPKLHKKYKDTKAKNIDKIKIVQQGQLQQQKNTYQLQIFKNNKKEEIRFDDDSWRNFQPSFSQLERKELNKKFNSQQLEAEINEQQLTKEIKEVEEQVTQFRNDINQNFDGAEDGSIGQDQ